jgi:hypothetical protein
MAMTEQLEAAQRATLLYRTIGLPGRLSRAVRRTFVWAIHLEDDGLAKAAMDESEGLVRPARGPAFKIEVLHSRSHLRWRCAWRAPVARRRTNRCTPRPG